ncbi:unnamed protein product [Rotaria socialis]|uniref:Uncharacterized protein n=1 Tax=Rotaria socialis TaxID=392032 RepID=A0A818B769_9BILA|nr:unnamed protein product [Rotaria socialis]
MLSALGHCEDPACIQSSSSSHEAVRLFRCSIHCDRLLCLFHLNSHNVLYEEEKKQTDAIREELQNSLTIYQRIFEQHIQSYRELVHQASTILVHNTSSAIPIEQIRPVLEKLQRAIAIFQNDKVIVKNEIEFDAAEINTEKIDLNILNDIPQMKKEKIVPTDIHAESSPRIVVRLERVQFDKGMEVGHKCSDEHIHTNQNQQGSRNESSRKLRDSINDLNTTPISTNHDGDMSAIIRLRRRTDENEIQNNKRPRTSSPISSGTKSNERAKMKKRS